MMTGSLSSPDFNLMFLPPSSWVEIAVDSARREVQIAALMKTLKKVLPRVDDSYAVLRRSIVSLFAQAWRSGVRYAIMPRVRLDGTVNMIAMFNVAILPPASPDGDDDSCREAIYQSSLKEREQFLEGEYSEIVSVENKSLGKGVQVSSVEYLQTGKGKNLSHKVSLFRAYFPTLNQTIVATGTCFQEEYRDILFQMFALMTSTLSIEPVKPAVESDEGGDDHVE